MHGGGVLLPQASSRKARPRIARMCCQLPTVRVQKPVSKVPRRDEDSRAHRASERLPKRVSRGPDEVFGESTSGAKHACALDRQQRLTCWGDGERGQIGAGQLTANVQPTPVLEAVDQVLAAEDATCALKSSGETLCWGYAVPGSGPQKHDQMIRVEVP